MVASRHRDSSPIAEALVALGFALLRYSLSRPTRRALPQILERVDRELPARLAHRQSPTGIRGLFATALADATGKPALAQDVEAVLGLYDPVRNAARNFGRGQ
jgi:hypothetical protein